MIPEARWISPQEALPYVGQKVYVWCANSINMHSTKHAWLDLDKETGGYRWHDELGLSKSIVIGWWPLPATQEQ